MSKPGLLIFASGTATGGGSGFERLVEHWQAGELEAEIVGVVSYHLNGGVKQNADRWDIPFIPFIGPCTTAVYGTYFQQLRADFVALSGWLKPVVGLDPRVTFNIHPGPLRSPGYNHHFGGDGMYGHFVHEAVLAASERYEINESAVSMHFVTPRYDEGPVFFRFPVPILGEDTPYDLARRVNDAEHRWQWQATNAVVTGEVHWDGVDPSSLVVPDRPYFVRAR